MSEYNNGAITALSYMAELGVSQKDIEEVLDNMSLSLDGIDESDKERFDLAFAVSQSNLQEVVIDDEEQQNCSLLSVSGEQNNSTNSNDDYEIVIMHSPSPESN